MKRGWQRQRVSGALRWSGRGHVTAPTRTATTRKAKVGKLALERREMDYSLLAHSIHSQHNAHGI